MKLEDLKKNYSVLEKKYNLPSFKEINEDFGIENMKKGEELLLKNIRKVMAEKIVNSLGFVETLLNPMNAPRMYLAYVKSMSAEDKKELDNIYSLLSETLLASLKLEIEYSEKGEADIIIKMFKNWNSLKPQFVKIMEHVEKPASFVPKEKSYFG